MSVMHALAPRSEYVGILNKDVMVNVECTRMMHVHAIEFTIGWCNVGIPKA
jgi:hypothetical protein